MSQNCIEIYDMCIDKTNIKDEKLLDVLKQVFVLAVTRIDDVVKAVQEKSPECDDVIYDAKAAIAYALDTAITVGMNAECETIMEKLKSAK